MVRTISLLSQWNLPGSIGMFTERGSCGGKVVGQVIALPFTVAFSSRTGAGSPARLFSFKLIFLEKGESSLQNGHIK